MITTPTPAGDWLAVVPVALPIITGAALLMLRKRLHWQAPIAVATLAVVFLATLALLVRVWTFGTVVMTMGRWLPPFGISFTVDLLGALFACTASLVALVCSVAAVQSVARPARRYGYFPFLLLTAVGVNGAFLTGDIFNLYVWFEVFLISSFGLLVVGSTRAQLDGTLKYGVLNLIGTTLFLIATGYLYGIFGTLNMADVIRKVPAVEGAPLMTLATLYLAAFSMKAAAFPVQAWLPASYHTPNVVTSAFFGGVLTKIGVYALLRVLVLLFPLQLAGLSGVIGWVAAATMVLGALGALAQSDIRRMVGFLVISGVGVMLAGLAVGTGPALAGGIFYAMHSMIALTALYLLAGLVAERAGSSSLHVVAGLSSAPVLIIAAFILMLSIAGLPPGSGLWPKIMVVQAALEAQHGWLTAAVLLSSLLTVITLGRFFLFVFWRPPVADGLGERPKRLMSPGPMLALTFLAVVMGLYPEPFVRAASHAADGLLQPDAYVRAVFGEQG
ncbi:Na+/H+ antiporter subunit D [Tianweitania sp. BSSL-BM11]|uniref:Na+/H+ antiporter subunit D n=1 Tax=Tianweitania aestuarii TaxID=2814886 RepID=A0ABS5RS29_9HYPH|nr:Na+/H+ antiporter subunit D [Tianweitania aestuarii]MBS9719860.1 Na+/H+ antiporter subunit D [Tianweitania aestuarii]